MPLPGKELMDDLCTRFVLNSPPEELESFERMLFLVEQAHWFYEDFVREEEPEANLQSLSLKTFAKLMFQQCPELQAYSTVLDAIYRQFNEYKQVIPVMGAIMLNPGLDKCLLVKSWGANGNWSFPRGKINPNESDIDCAAREVLEETGMDLKGRLREDWCIELHLAQKRTKLYLVPGIDEAFPFHPRVRKEIAAFAWHDIAALPSTRQEDAQVYSAVDGTRHRFFMVWNYVRQLRRWAHHHRKASASPAPGQGPSGKRTRSRRSATLKSALASGPTLAAKGAAAAREGKVAGKGRSAATVEFETTGEDQSSSIEALLSKAASTAHTSSAAGLQGITAAASQGVQLGGSSSEPAAEDQKPYSMPGLLSSQQHGSVQQQKHAAAKYAAGGQLVGATICTATAFSSSALTAFQFDKAKIALAMEPQAV